MSDQTLLTWLGTAGWLIRRGRTCMVTDPFLSRPAGVAPFPRPRDELAEADVILCTHGHFDHAMDLEQVARLSHAPIWAPAVICRRLADLGIHPDRLHANENAQPTRVGSIALEPVASRHIRYDLPLAARTLWSSMAGARFRELAALGLLWPMGSNTDFLLQLGDHRLYLSGSLGQSAQRLRAHPADVAMLPYNGRSDMARVVVEAASALRPRLLLPHHFDDFYPSFAPPQDPRQALPRLRRKLPGLKVHIPRPGETFALEPLLQ